MFCRNCGKEMNDNAAVCVSCGVAKGDASNFCPNCGSETSVLATVCVKCGIALNNKNGTNSFSGEKTKTVAGVLAIFLGFFGAHEFYLGNNKKAVTRLIVTAVAFILIKLFDTLLASLSGLSFLGTIGWIVMITVGVLNICDAVKIFKGKRTDASGNALQ